MAAYEVLLLNTAIPQIQAAQSGDTYVVPRDIAFSTVASLAAGTEALPSLVATGDVNTGFWFPAADTIAASTGGTRRLTLDSSGNLGIGTTSPGAKLEVAASGSSQQLRLVSTGNSILRTRWIDATAGFTLESNNTTETAYDPFTLTGSVLRFNTGAGSLAMTLDASGNLLVGITALPYNAERLAVYKSGNAEAAAFVNEAGANNYTVAMSNRATTGDNKFVVFATESSDTTRGSITYNRAGGLVAYNTTSDYRAKDILGPVTNTGATIDALKVYNGKMNGASVERPMLIAHEAQEFAPYAVVGNKDAVDEDGNPVFQQMDVSSLVPLLIAEIQSLRARVAQLEAK
jgi:hypothetical protein